MARFDWIQLFKRHNIHYVTEGPNFSRKMTANVRCPYCGDADPSEHLGVSDAGWWGCLRNAAHRGKTPHFLIQRLIGCSPAEAHRIVGTREASTPTTDDLAASFAALKRATGTAVAAPPRHLDLLPEFKSLANGSSFAEPFIEYLRGRGFRRAQVEWLTKQYGLLYATKGRYAYRIIVPVYDRYGKLLTWTARSIQSDAKLRYSTLRASGELDDGKGPIALAPDKETVLGLPTLYAARSPKILLLVEGPFDALKLTAFGWGLGVYAAALFGLNVSASQVNEVLELSSRFERTYLLLDAGAEFHKLRLASTLSVVNPTIISVPDEFKDPGDMTPEAIVSFALQLLSDL